MNDFSYMIRKARPEDLDAIVELWGIMMTEHERNDPRIRLAAGAVPAYRSYLGYHVSNADSCVRVAETPSGCAGFCLLTVSRNLPMFLPERYGYLSDLMVEEAYRRQGMGRALLAAALDWSRKMRIECVQLQHYCFNEKGKAFWQKMGFKPYYSRMWLDLL